MKKRYHLVFFFFILQITSSFGQNLSLSGLPRPICVGTPISVTIVTDVTFESTNQLTLQTRPDYFNSSYTSLPFTRTGNVLTFQFPGSLVGYDLQFMFRLVSSAPALEGTWTSSIPVYAPANVRLTSVSPALGNTTEPFNLRFEAVGTPPITVTLSDSSRQSLNPAYRGDISFTSTVPFFTSSSGTYSLQSAENVCGLGKASGQVDLKVNPISVRTVSVSPSSVCRGGTLTVAYSKMGPSFNSANRFKVLLTETDRLENPLSYLLDAKEVNGGLQVVIPDSETDQSTRATTFNVSVISSDPVVVGSSNKVIATVYPRSSAVLTTPSATINYGETISLNVSLQGILPYQVSVSDGTTIYETGASYNPYNPPIEIKPKKSATYRITRFQSACLTNSLTPSSTVVVVNPGITIDSLPSQYNPVCEGQTVRIKFSTNSTLGSDNRFSIILNQLSGSWTSDPISPRLEADNVLAFEIPTLPANTTNDTRLLSVALLTTSPVMRSLPNRNQNLSVSRKPTYVQFTDFSSQITLENPGVALFSLYANGGGPYKLVINDGQHDLEQSWSSWPYATATVFKTTTFTVRSIANNCGVFDNPNAKAVVTVQRPAPAQIYLAPLAKYTCENDSTTAVFEPTGNFLPGNEFRVQMASVTSGYGYGWSDLEVVGRGSQSPIRFKVPVTAKVRIVSTNPVAFSNEQQVEVVYKLSATIPTSDSNYDLQYARGVPPRTFVPGEPIVLPISVSPDVGSVPYSLTYTDGTRKYTYQGNSTTATQADLKPAETTTYQLLGISNVCSTGQVNGKITFTAMPFRISVPISMAYADSQRFAYSVCGGGNLTIPFFTSAVPPPGTQFTLQIASTKDSLFSDLVSTTTSPITAPIPASQAAGLYLVRIVAKGTTAQTQPIPVRILQLPSAILRAPASTTVSGGENIQTTLTLTGTAPWEVLFSGNILRAFYSSPATVIFQPAKATTYSIKAVTNGCGYGTGTGEVSVRVKPTLSIERTYSSNGIDCKGSTIALSYQALGDFEAGNQFSIELTDVKGNSLRTLTKLAASNGKVTVSLPSDLAVGQYQLALKATSPATSALLGSDIYLRSTPSARLSGSTVINAGQTVYLMLRDEENIASRMDFIAYQLSDGTSGQLSLTGSVPASIPVKPTQTTTYTIQNISGSCGTGRAQGSAMVTVNPPGERSVVTDDLGRQSICTGDSLSVNYSTRGSFSNTNRFQVQLLDSTGNTLKTLPTNSTASPLRVLLPRDVPSATGYRLRVVASDANTQSSASLYPLQISQGITAAFDSTVVIRQSGQPITLTLRFGGTGPWDYAIRTESGSYFGGTATASPWRIKPSIQAVTYSLIGVNSYLCGAGIINSPATIRIELLTATDPAWSVEIGPNPTRDVVRINLPAVAETVTIQLTNLNGQSLLTRRVKSPSTALSLASFPAGIYLLSVEVNNRRSVYRLVKE